MVGLYGLRQVYDGDVGFAVPLIHREYRRIQFGFIPSIDASAVDPNVSTSMERSRVAKASKLCISPALRDGRYFLSELSHTFESKLLIVRVPTMRKNSVPPQGLNHYLKSTLGEVKELVYQTSEPLCELARQIDVWQLRNAVDDSFVYLEELVYIRCSGVEYRVVVIEGIEQLACRRGEYALPQLLRLPEQGFDVQTERVSGYYSSQFSIEEVKRTLINVGTNSTMMPEISLVD